MLLRILMYDKYRMIETDKNLQRKLITPAEIKELERYVP